ncbi:unnamed protein product [Urochloa decumbens]|uniref:AAA+ ATPase domain-containing protein n=1 Tax=Urochloa decumbens TaxID=240449 RepID=A0ABC9C1S5_9POAL
MAEGAVKAAVDKLEELAMQEVKFQSQVGKEVRALKDELEWVSTFLGDADCRRRREVNEYIELWVRQTREVAFDAEDLLEEFFHKGELHCRGCLDLPSLLSWLKHSFLGLFVRHTICHEVNLIKERLGEIKKMRDDYQVQNLPTTWAPSQRHYSDWHTLEPDFEHPTTLLVGIDENYNKILEWLQSDEERRTVIAITGKSGIGKTTLASCIVANSSVWKEFECVVWVRVPEKYKLLELLNGIIQQATGPTEKSNAAESEEMIRDELSQKLSCKRCLIILDDVRNLEEWKFFLTVLPDEGNRRSRVIITTQIKFSVLSDDHTLLDNDKVEPVQSRGLNLCNYHLELKKLDQNHGKELFCKRVFGKNTFPTNFCDSEKNIEPLLHVSLSPLAITLLAGLLRSKREDEWIEVTNQILHFDKKSPTDTNSVEKQQEEESGATLRIQYKQLHLMDKILMLSFDDLPLHLKQCFLYFAAFQAEVGIDSRKLIHLWVAEGFVQPTDRQTMEECGQHYLKMLISRCLINLVKTDYNNNIITVSIHERVLAFARSEARETNFIQVHSCTTNLSRTSIRRLSFQNIFDSHTILTLVSPKLRSLLCDIPETVGDDPIKGMATDFPSNGNLWKKTLDIFKGHLDNSAAYHCKLLRVIDLKGVAHQHTLPKEIGLLIHVRYLGLAHTGLRSLPKSVKKLRSLQTLDISNTRIKVVPQSFWKIKTLRHVQANSLKNGPEEVDALNNLQTLHGVPWGQWAQNTDFLQRLDNLQSLRAWKLSSNIVSSLTKLEFLMSLDLQADETVELPLTELLTSLALCRLQYLRLQGKATAAAELNPSYLLPNLTILELYESELVQGHIDTIAKLPSLIELELGKNSYNEEQEEINIPDYGFSKLRKLKLNRLPKLKSLKVTNHWSEQWGLQYVSVILCTELLKIREDFNKLKHLKVLTVDNMPNNKFPSKCKICPFTSSE